MNRLSPQTLSQITDRSIARPGYDRAALRPGLAHIGVGAFHRCHQADYIEDLLESGREDRFVTGVTLRPPEMAPLLKPQGGLYTRTLVENDDRRMRVMGCLRAFVDSPGGDTRAARAALTAEHITVVTMTVTEKGYCHVPATGALNPDHPDIIADLADPEAPVSLPGVLVAVLDARRRTHGRGLTLMSCDNVPANGRVLEGVVRTLAQARDQALADWIAGNVRFPVSMVDRIVPATTESDLRAAAQTLGLEDAAPVVGEPFRQWVIEACDAPDMPDWAAVGAQIVPDVEPYERVKMRVVNGTQSAMAHIGCLAGLPTSADGIRHPILRSFLRQMLETETAPTLPTETGWSSADIDKSFARLENRAIHHSNHQIATDGSQKIVQRLIRPARERLADGASAPLLTAAIAAWAAYLAAGSKRYGARWTASDPLASGVAKLAEQAGTISDLASAILALDVVFDGDLGRHPAFVRGFTTALDAWLTRPAEAVLSDLTAGRA